MTCLLNAAKIHLISARSVPHRVANYIKNKFYNFLDLKTGFINYQREFGYIWAWILKFENWRKDRRGVTVYNDGLITIFWTVLSYYRVKLLCLKILTLKP